jgi:hypothetical protein
MQINMTTFAGRRHHYIQQTLQSLFSSNGQGTHLTVNLIVGSEDESHLQEYAAQPAVRIISWDMETNSNLRWNCTLNKIRALRYGDDQPTLVCEDDILFKPHWLATLAAAMARLGDEEYIMSLYTDPTGIEGAPAVRGTRLVKRYPTFDLVGAQALFYPTKALRSKVADYLQKNLVRATGDNLIGQYARAHAELYATADPLVENIGWISCFQ